MNRGTVTRSRIDLHNTNVVGVVNIRKTGALEWRKEQRVNAQVYTNPANIITQLGTVTGTAAYYRSCVQLFDGRVMFIPNGNITATNNPVRFYNPATNTTRTTSYTVKGVRTAVTLNDGRVYLIPITSNTVGVGGQSQAYLFNPVDETFITSSATYEAVTQFVNNSVRTATLLPSGEVYVMGSGSIGNGAYIYDPIRDSLRPIDSAPNRGIWTTTLLPDGRVYCMPVAGAAPVIYQTAFIYNPLDDMFTTASTSQLSVNNKYTKALTLPDGRVLNTPGDLGTGSYYDPNTDTFSTAFITSAAANFSRYACLLPNGNVYIVPNNINAAGGRIFNPRTNVLTNGPTSYDNFNGGTATLMSDGRVFMPPANGTSFNAYGSALPISTFLPFERVHSPYSGNRVSGNYGG